MFFIGHFLIFSVPHRSPQVGVALVHHQMVYFISPLWQLFSLGDWLILSAMLIAAVVPYAMAFRDKTSLALATTVSILLVYVVQTFTWILWWFGLGWHDPLIALVAIPDLIFQPGEWHRFLTAAWIHSPRDITHVLGNALIIALVGVPLEQRLGRSRFMLVYLLGAFAGNLAWCVANLGDFSLGLGASGAAFGLLGIYLAAWPRDEIEFPLIIIRPWPVQLIALLYFGIEVARAWAVHGMSQPSHVAHVAHLSGFLVCYALGRPIARGGPVMPDSKDSGPSQSGAIEAARNHRKGGMASLDENPWNDSEHLLSDKAARTLERLRQEGDELETREAWLDRLSEQAKCPQCGASLKMSGEPGNHSLSCSKSQKHISWP